MVFYAAFNSIPVILRRQLTLFMLSWVSPVLDWALKCLAQGHSHEKTQRIQSASNPGPLDYESNTLPLSNAGPTTARKLSFLPTELNIFDIRQHYVRILFIFQRLILLSFMSNTDKHESSSIWKWISSSNDEMNHVDYVIKRDLYPQKMHSCCKTISGISVFVVKISV